jgi:hypothetical protein
VPNRRTFAPLPAPAAAPGILDQLAADLRWAAKRLRSEQGQPTEAAYDWQTVRGMERAANLLEQWAAIADGGRHYTAKSAAPDDAHLARTANALAEVGLNWTGVGRRPADQYRAMAARLHHLGLLAPPPPTAATFTCGGTDCKATASTESALADWSHPAGGPWLCPACAEQHWTPAARTRLASIPEPTDR